jgi:hypothetical protein
VIGWYGLSIQVGRALGLLAVLGAMARAFIAFGTWRTAFRARLLGVESHERSLLDGGERGRETRHETNGTA